MKKKCNMIPQKLVDETAGQNIEEGNVLQLEGSLLYKDLNSYFSQYLPGNEAREMATELYTLYKGDETPYRYKETGEPTAKYILDNYLGDILESLEGETSIISGSRYTHFIPSHYRYFNLVLSDIFMSHINEFQTLSTEDIRLADTTVKSVLDKLLIAELEANSVEFKSDIKEYRIRKGKVDADKMSASFKMFLKFREDFAKADSAVWRNFVNYMGSTHNVHIRDFEDVKDVRLGGTTYDSTKDVEDAEMKDEQGYVQEMWNDEQQLTVNIASTIPGKIKARISNLLRGTIDENGRAYMYLSQPYSINEMYVKLIQAHRGKTDEENVRRTIVALTKSTNKVVFEKLLNEFDSDKEFRSAYVTSFAKVVSSRAILLTIKKKEATLYTQNSNAFGEDAAYEIFLEKIKTKLRTKEKYNNTPELIIRDRGRTPTGKIEGKYAKYYVNQVRDYLNNELGLPITEVALESYLLKYALSNNPKLKADDLYSVDYRTWSSEFWNIVDKSRLMLNVLQQTTNPETVDFKGYLNFMTKISSFDINTPISLSYLNAMNELQYTSQYGSYLTKIFKEINDRGFVDENAVKEYFEPFTKVNYLKDDNFLWNKGNGFGIFNLDGSVNRPFIEALAFDSYLGVSSQTSSAAYQSLLGNAWGFNQILLASTGRFTINTGDSPRMFYVSAPLIMSGKSSFDDYFKDKKNDTLEAMYNIVRGDLNEYKDAKRLLFKNDEVKSDEELKKLHKVKHYAVVDGKPTIYELDDDGKPIKNKHGKPIYAGKSFKFVTLRYPKGDKLYSFLDFLEDKKLDIDTLSDYQLDNQIRRFTNEFVVFAYDKLRTKFEVYRDAFYNIRNSASYNTAESSDSASTPNGLIRKISNETNVIWGISKLDRNFISSEIDKFGSHYNKRFKEFSEGKTGTDSQLRNQFYSMIFKEEEAAERVKQEVRLLDVFLNNMIVKSGFHNILGSSITETSDQIKWNKYNTGGIKNGANFSNHDGTGEVTVLIAKSVKGTNKLASTMIDLYEKNGAMDVYNKLTKKNAIDKTDGLSIITDKHLEKFLASSRGLSAAQRKLLRDLRDGKSVDFKQALPIFEQIKTYAIKRGVKTVDGVSYPSTEILKDSTIILFKAQTKDTEMEKLYDWMNKHGIDQLSFDSAYKEGGTSSLEVFDEDGKFVAGDYKKEDVDLSKTIFNIENYVIQQDVSAHILDKTISIGSQVTTAAFEGLDYNNASYKFNNKDYKGLDIARELSNTLHALVQNGFFRLLDKFNGLENGKPRLDNNNISFDRVEFINSFRDNLLKNIKNQNEIDAISKFTTQLFDENGQELIYDDTTLLALSNPIIYGKLVASINALISKHTIRQEIAGLHVPIMPNTGWQPSMSFGEMTPEKIDEYAKTGAITYFDDFLEEVKSGKRKNFDLLNERRSKDGYEYADVILNVWDSQIYEHLQKTVDGKLIIDTSKIDDDVRNMVGFRIPTDGKQSVVIFRVVGFLNTGTSQAQFPYDLILQTGWDFDIDTIYAMRKNAFVDPKDGRYKAYDYNIDNSNAKLYAEEYAKKYFFNDYYNALTQSNTESKKGGYFEIFSEGYASWIALESTRYLNQFYTVDLGDNRKGIDWRFIRNTLGGKTTNNLRRYLSATKRLEKQIYRAMDLVTNSSQVKLPLKTVHINHLLQKVSGTKERKDDVIELIKKNKNALKIELTDKELKYLETLYVAIAETAGEVASLKDDVLRDIHGSDTQTRLGDTIINKYYSPAGYENLKRIFNKANYGSFNFGEDIIVGKDEAGNPIKSLYSAKTSDKIKDAITNGEKRIKEFMTGEKFLNTWDNLHELERLPREAVENRLVDVFKSIYGNEYHFVERTKPNSFDNFESINIEINKFYKHDINVLMFNDMLDEIDLNDLNMASRVIKAYSVSTDRAIRILGAVGARINGEAPSRKILRSELDPSWSDKDIIARLNRNYGEENVKILYDADGSIIAANVVDRLIGNNWEHDNTDISGHRFTEQVSEVTANTLDAVKHPLGFNMNPASFEIVSAYAMGASMTYLDNKWDRPNTWNRFAFGAYLLHQQILIDAMNSLNIENIFGNGKFEDSINNQQKAYLKALYNIAKKYDFSDTDIDRSFSGKKMRYNLEMFDKIGRHILTHFKYEGDEFGNKTITDKIKGPVSATELRSWMGERSIVIDENTTAEEDYKTAMFIINNLKASILAIKAINIMGEVKEVGFATKTEDTLGDTAGSLITRSKRIADLYLTVPEFVKLVEKEIEDGGITEQYGEDLINTFKDTVDLESRAFVTNTFLEEATHNKELPEKKIVSMDGKNLINVFFPQSISAQGFISDGEMHTEEIYSNPFGFIEAKHLFGNEFAKNVLAKLFAAQNKDVRREIASVFNGKGKKADKIIRVLDNKMNYFLAEESSIIKYFNANPAEYARILNFIDKPSQGVPVTDLKIEHKNKGDNNTYYNNDKDTFVAFSKLPLYQKIQVLRESKLINDYVNTSKFKERHILNKIRIRSNKIEDHGYVRLSAHIDSEFKDDYAASLADMYYNSNPYLANVARDIIYYALLHDGFSFGVNISSMMDVSILGNDNAKVNLTYSKYLQEYGLETKLPDITSFNNQLKLLDNQNFNGTLNITRGIFKDYVARQMFNNWKIVPRQYSKEVLDDMILNGNDTATLHRTFAIPIPYKDAKGHTKTENVLFKVENSNKLKNTRKYRFSDYMYDTPTNTLYKKALRNGEYTLYVSTSKLMPFEFSEFSGNPSYNPHMVSADAIAEVIKYNESLSNIFTWWAKALINPDFVRSDRAPVIPLTRKMAKGKEDVYRLPDNYYKTTNDDTEYKSDSDMMSISIQEGDPGSEYSNINEDIVENIEEDNQESVNQTYLTDSEYYISDNVTDAVTTVIGNSDENVWVGDTDSVAGKLHVKANAKVADITKDPIEEADRIATIINREAGSVNISGVETIDALWGAAFINRLQSNLPTKTKYNTFKRKGIGDLVYAVGTDLAQTTYKSASDNIVIDTDSLSVVRDKIKDNISELIDSYTILGTIENMSQNVKIPNALRLSQLSTRIRDSKIVSKLLDQDSSDVFEVMEEALVYEAEIADAIIYTLDKLHDQLALADVSDPSFDVNKKYNPINLNDIFKNEERRTQYQHALSKATDFANALNNLSRLKTYTYEDAGLNENVQSEVDQFERIYAPINKLVKELKQKYANSTNQIENIRILSQRFVTFAFTYNSKRTDAPTIFREVIDQANLRPIEQIDVKISEREIQETMEFLFKNNEDLSIIMANMDSSFDTGNPLIDNLTKEFAQNLAKAKKKYGEFYDRVVDITKEFNPKLANDKTWFKKYLTPHRTILSEYKWADFTTARYESEYNRDKEYFDTVKRDSLVGDQRKILYSKLTEKYRKDFIKNHVESNKALDKNEFAMIQSKIANMPKERIHNYMIKNNLNFRTIRYKQMTDPSRIGYSVISTSVFDKKSGKRVKTDKVTDFTYVQIIERYVPKESYKSRDWALLSDKEKNMLEKVSSLIHDIVESSTHDMVVSKDFFPFLKFMDYKAVLHSKFMAVTSDNVAKYNRPNGTVGYYMSPESMSAPKYYGTINSPENDKFLDDAEYEKVKVDNANEVYAKFKNKLDLKKVLGKDKFENSQDIRKYNFDANKENNIRSKDIMNASLIDVIGNFANELTHIQGVEDFVSVFDIAMDSVKNHMKFIRKTISGDSVVDKAKSLLMGEKEWVSKEGGNTRMINAVERILPIIYGVRKGSVGSNKWVQPIAKFTSMTYMWGNYLSGIKNVMTGYHHEIIESLGGNMIKASDLRAATTQYMGLVPEFLSGLSKGFDSVYTENKHVALIKYFDSIFQDRSEQGTFVKGSDALAKAIVGLDDAMYSPNNIGEHFMQFTMLLAMANSHRVVNGIIMNEEQFKQRNLKRAMDEVFLMQPTRKLKFDKWVKERKSQVKYLNDDSTIYSQFVFNESSDFRDAVLELRDKYNKESKAKFDSFDKLNDVLTVKNGRLSWDEEKVSLREISDFGTKVKRVNQSMHGVYNAIDRSALQDHLFGDLLFQFKKWVRPNMRRYFGRRFGRDSFNEGLGTWEVPIYGIFPALSRAASEWAKYNTEEGQVRTALGNWLVGMIHTLGNFKTYYNTLDNTHRAAYKKFGSHVAFVLFAIGTYILLTSKKDDEDDFYNSLFYDTLMYISSAWTQEVTETVPLVGWIGFTKRLFNNPLASQKVMSDTIEVFQALYGEVDGDPTNDIYDRGVYKGASKLKIKTGKMIPIYRQYQKQIYIPQYSAFYKMNNIFF